MAPDLDRTGWDGVGATESHGHSLVGATGPREPGRGLSRVPTDDEFVHSVVSQDEMTQGAGLRAARRARAISACLLMGASPGGVLCGLRRRRKRKCTQ